jgi:hypothetical protein
VIKPWGFLLLECVKSLTIKELWPSICPFHPLLPFYCLRTQHSFLLEFVSGKWELALSMNQTFWNLDSGLPASRMGRNKFFVYKLPSLGNFVPEYICTKIVPEFNFSIQDDVWLNPNILVKTGHMEFTN